MRKSLKVLIAILLIVELIILVATVLLGERARNAFSDCHPAIGFGCAIPAAFTYVTGLVIGLGFFAFVFVPVTVFVLSREYKKQTESGTQVDTAKFEIFYWIFGVIIPLSISLNYLIAEERFGFAPIASMGVFVISTIFLWRNVTIPSRRIITGVFFSAALLALYAYAIGLSGY